MLQQYLPFTVLKQYMILIHQTQLSVATVLTVYGIETNQKQYMRIVFYVLK